MANISDTPMTYTQSNKIDRLTKLYIEGKRNPKEILSEEAREWRNHVCKSTPDDPYGNTLSFPEAFADVVGK